MDFFKKCVCGQDVETETPLHSSLSPKQTVGSKYDRGTGVFSPSLNITICKFFLFFFSKQNNHPFFFPFFKMETGKIKYLETKILLRISRSIKHRLVLENLV